MTFLIQGWSHSERGRPGSCITFGKSVHPFAGITHTFCPECGTSISYFDEGLRDELYLAIGFFDHPERFSPQAHAYWQMKLPWISFSDDLSHTEGYSRRRDPTLGNPVDR